MATNVINQGLNNNPGYWDARVSFWDPVKFGQYAQTKNHKALERIDEYFHLDGRVAVVAAAPINNQSTPVNFREYHPFFIDRVIEVIKTISYATLIIPTIMLIAKCILRLTHHFHSIPPAPRPNDFALPFSLQPFPNNDFILNDLEQIDATTEHDAITPALNNDPVAKLLQAYKIGNNAKSCSELMLKIHNNIPEPDDLQLYALPFRLALLRDVQICDEEDNVVKRVDGDIIEYYYGLLNKGSQRTPWEDRFLKMTIHIHEAIMKLKGDELQSARAVLAGALINAFAHCTNRKSTEIERLYNLYVIPDLLAAAQDADMPQEALLYEFMNCRMNKREEIINTQCYDNHNAASHRYFRKKLDEAVFYLPPPPLCVEDENFASYAMKGQENAIIQAFRTYYHDPKTIYDIFVGLIHPKSGEKFQYMPGMFHEWLQEDPDRAANAFDEENYTAYKPEIIIAFLVEKGFLAPK